MGDKERTITEPKKKLRVLVACEESQVVCKAFRERGHEAYSCDLQACSGGHPQWHLQTDALKALRNQKGWDLVIAHPPCTRLANSGVRWLEERNLWSELASAVEFFREFQKYAEEGNAVAIENPIPHRYAKEGFLLTHWEGVDLEGRFITGIGEYTQLIQPWQFGHPEQKATCLWLKGLTALRPTEVVEGREQRIWKLPPSEDRAKLRSKTYPGIAKAMAATWSEDLGNTWNL